MPLYEFSCKKCGHAFEELLMASELERARPKCPACGSPRTERGISSFAAQTGSGGGSGGGSCGGGGCGSGGFT